MMGPSWPPIARRSFFRNDEKLVQSYDNANKILNLDKGAADQGRTCGAGGHGNASISTLSKDYCANAFRVTRGNCADRKLDPESDTMEVVAKKARESC